jgi:N5-(cytidine 5'-diphosphoramidyl)-L-glutamine hydrolase
LIIKNIAITQRLVLNDSYYELREALDIEWGGLFQTLNYLPIVLPIEYDFEKYFTTIDIGGILLTGGNDINTYKSSEISFKRDFFEKKLIDYGIKNDIPILGVCRGMQLIANYFGSSFKRVEEQVAIKHKLVINKDSKYFNKLIKLGKVNSYHDYAVAEVPKELLISATNESGVIKSIEHREYKIFGQMWHSERETPFDKDEIALIKNFFNYK